jgi:translation initiation factor 1
MSRNSNPLAYSTDGSHRDLCSRCGRNPCACPPPAEIVPERTRLLLRLDKKGRGGKAVTVLSELPPHPDYWTRLLQDLKAHCGAGGTIKEATLEIQGDQRGKVQAFLERLGFTIRRSGS